MSDEKFFELFNPKDFESMSLKISLLNLTTQTEISQGKRTYGDKTKAAESDDNVITLVEFLENGMIVEVPLYTGAEGHQAKLSLQTEGAPKREIEFLAVCKIQEVQKLPKEKRERFTLEFSEFDPTGWAALMEVYAGRQKEILEFFDAVKG